MAKGQTFKIDTNAVSRLGDKLGKSFEKYDRVMENRMAQATEIIWRTAHARRPMITKMQMKAEGRRVRVSDPNAQAGVPVAAVNGGRLQQSIKQYVKRIKSMSFRGIIETVGIPYAGYIEYGTSKMQARPFMRPAVGLNREVIKRVFGARVDSNL